MVPYLVLDVCVWASCPRGELEGNGLFALRPTADGLEEAMGSIAEAIVAGLDGMAWKRDGKLEVYIESRPSAACKKSRLDAMEGKELTGLACLDWCCHLTALNRKVG